MTDPEFETLLAAAQGGDPGALDQVFREFYPRVQRMVHRRLQLDIRTGRPWLTSRFSTGDVVQDVFRSVLGDLRGFTGRGRDAFAGYLAMIVRNRIIDAVRFHEAEQRDGRRAAVTGALEEHPSREREPDGVAESADEAERFRAALESLGEREQLLVRARIEGTASFRELTERLGYTSRDAARRAFFAAQARITRLLQADARGDAESR